MRRSLLVLMLLRRFGAGLQSRAGLAPRRARTLAVVRPPWSKRLARRASRDDADAGADEFAAAPPRAAPARSSRAARASSARSSARSSMYSAYSSA